MIYCFTWEESFIASVSCDTIFSKMQTNLKKSTFGYLSKLWYEPLFNNINMVSCRFSEVRLKCFIVFWREGKTWKKLSVHLMPKLTVLSYLSKYCFTFYIETKFWNPKFGLYVKPKQVLCSTILSSTILSFFFDNSRIGRF